MAGRRRKTTQRRPFRFGCLAVGWMTRLFVSPGVYRLLEGDRALERLLEDKLREHDSRLPSYLPRGKHLSTSLYHRGRTITIQSVCGGSQRLETRVYRA